MTSNTDLRAEIIRRRLTGRARTGSRAVTHAIPRADRNAPLPLSFGQERMWLLHQLDPASPAYLVPLVLRLRGALDVAALRQAVDQVVARHEILRTRYPQPTQQPQAPVQVIDPHAPVELPVTDLSHLPGAEERALEQAEQDAARPIDLAAEHPCRVRLYRTGRDAHLLVIVLHHIACDDWSLGVLWQELGELYRAAVAGEPADLEPLPTQYADYAAWQRARMSGELLERRLEYWRGRLDGLRPVELPTDRPRPHTRDQAGDRHPFQVPAELTLRLREVARRHDTTLYVVLLTAFQALLARHTGTPDVAVGSAVGGRTRREEQGLIGFLLDTVVMRAAWSGDPAFADLLRDNRSAVLDALEHRDVPVQRLTELDRNRSASRSALFQVMFDLLEEPPHEVRLPGLVAEPVDLASTVAKYDLTLQLAELPGGALYGAVEYATALFDRDTADRLARRYLRLLEHVADAPDTRVGDLDLLDEAERRRLLRRPPAAPVVETPSEAVARWAAATPDAPAVVSGGVAVSFAELDRRANRIARRLRELGAGPESCVGVCLGRGPDLLPALLGVWRAGAAYVPLDPSHPPARLADVLSRSGARLVVTDSPGGHGTRAVDPAEAAELSGEPLDVSVDPDSLAYTVYTSGSTGRPKGVLVSHAGLRAYLSWAKERYAGAGHGAPLLSSPAFDLAVTSLYVPLVTGAPVRMLPEGLPPGRLGAELAAAGPYDFVKLTPGHLELLVRQLGPEQAAGLCGTLVVGGEAFPTRLYESWRELAGDGARVVNEYGPTEITVANAAHTAAPTPAATLPIGGPAPGTTAYVLDEAGKLAPVGVVGEIHVGGAQVARGYRDLAAASAQRFVPDPFGPPGSRLYRTGDLGRVLPGGELEFIGRADDQVKIAGYRIEPGEVEQCLREAPDVAAAVVIARDGRLIAYVVPEPGQRSPADLREHLSRRLPPYLVPAVVVPIEAIPLTANGKTDHAALPSPDRDDLLPGAAPAELASELHVTVAAAWGQVLGLAEVGADDNFFDLGGDSLRAVALVGALRAAELDLAVQDVFEHPTVDALCELLGTRTGRAAAHAGARPFELVAPQDADRLPGGLTDAYPLSLVQAGMVYEMLADGAANNYHNTTTFTVRDGHPFSAAAFRAAAATVVARHEALRTAIDVTSYSTPMQLVHEHAELRVDVRDARHVPEPERAALIEGVMTRERATLFDLGRPSLLRAVVHVWDGESWALTVSECHAVLEGWSYNVMLMELLDCYRQLAAGRAADLPDLPEVRFADFVKAEQEALDSPEDQAFWQGVVERYPPLALPAAWAGGPGEDGRPYKVEVLFDDLADQLAELAEGSGVPLKSVLHAAHLKVMSMLTDQEAFSSGLVCDARPEVLGADRVLGMYLNTVPFGFGLSAQTWRRLVEDVFAREIELWPYRRLPVPAIQRELAGGRRLNEVMFNYLDFRMIDFDRVGAGTLDDSPNEFPLSVTVFKLGTVDLTIHPRLISRANGARLGRMYRLVLEAMCADPDGDALAPCLPEEELDPRCNATARDLGEGLLPDLFEARAAAEPTATALVTAEGERVTYAEVDARANAVAWHLRSLGAGRGDFVGIHAELGADLVAGLMGIVKSGAAYVPLDPANPPERNAAALDDSGARVVLTRDVVAGLAPVRSRPPRETHPDDVVYAIFTSGSTGRPKGVMVTHGGLANYLLWAARAYRAGSGCGAPMLGSAAFDLSVTNLLVPLVAGRAVTMIPEPTDAAALAGLLRGGERFSLLKLTPAHLDLLCAELDGERIESVGCLVVGGEALKSSTVQAWRRIAPRCRIVNEYGPTETVVGCSVHEWDPADGTGALPIGRPIANMRLHVLDRALAPVPVGARGELCVAGPGVARGYAGRPAATAERFVPDPYGPPGSRLYRTGDVAVRREDGALDYLGRSDEQVKIRGYRVEPGEVEQRLLELPGVTGAVVVARDGRLVAYVVGDHHSLREELSRRLPPYLIPATFVPLAALPVGPGGKVDRRQLPAPGGEEPSRPYQAPGSAAERVLAGIFCQVLGLRRAGADDDFFELGGDSILSLNVVSAARRAGLPLSPRMILAGRTVAGVARQADACASPPGPATGGVASGTVVPLAPAQRRFLELDTDHADFTQSVHLLVDPPADRELLERALNAVVAHHDALRLRLRGDGQAVAEREHARLLRAVDADDAGGVEEMVRHAAEAGRRLDPEHGPVFGALLFPRTAGQPDELVLLAHRLVVDGVSWQFLVDDLTRAYVRLTAAEPVDLPPASTPFADWARRLAAYARSDEALHRLPAPRRRPLPVDHPEGENTAASAATEHAALDLPARPARMRDLLLAALAVTLSGWSGDDGALVELESHGREDLFDDVDLSRTVGYFTTYYPLDLPLPPGCDPAAALEAVTARLGEAPLDGVAYAAVRYSRGDEHAKRLARLPAPQVCLNYLGRRDAHPGRGGPFVPATGRITPAASDTGTRPHLLEVNASEYAGRLDVALTYSTAIHTERTARRLLADLLANLRSLL
ncbi:non-ribosomal peptide synthetase [Nonomuraea sediminis]|uniref:non-ribosomal peptide synthetase n=1 Tax=Nonomuraea sediminis TaxID=2835864 RepID=UPI001BDC6C23|nr:non-ribosomal peptide synthetase [Nonomuraea sediminis]